VVSGKFDKSEIVHESTMQIRLPIMLFSVIAGICARAQPYEPPSLNLGDNAPDLRLNRWLKGEPIKNFKKGKTYIIEFWATWCEPCIAEMPHLSKIAEEYKGRVEVVGVDVKETRLPGKAKRFVDSMGMRMNYHVGADANENMFARWMTAGGEQGIPKTFVVDRQGRLAWIGHPSDLDKVLPVILNDSWDLKVESEKRKYHKLLSYLDSEANYDLMDYMGTRYDSTDMGKPDSLLLMIDKLVKNEPGLKYAPFMAFNTFVSLLKTDQQKAYDYGKTVIVTRTYEEPAYFMIIGAINLYSKRLKLAGFIYKLGADALQIRIDSTIHPELKKMSKLYSSMAEFYWLAGDKPNAISVQKKAVDVLEKSKYLNAADLLIYEERLRLYTAN
jgi:thiol-disulfide isomerase/thioredoxin